ncbi:MAG: hypothetical protein FJW27_19555 [Acidimicrobiia bacterium]|nr:hypothetical protein [Acidimicrobiia bacterium]
MQLAFLFLLYEFVGIVTNLVGGCLAARTGLRLTLFLEQWAGVSAPLWGAVVLAGVAGAMALTLPPVSARTVSWASAKGDE